MAEERALSVRVPTGGVFSGRVTPPPSKSVTQRYLNLALLAGRSAAVEKPLLADDTLAFLEALPALGLAVERVSEGGASAVRLAPRPGATTATVDCRASGTMARFLAASLCTLPGVWKLDGTPRLRERPLAPLLDALRSLGGELRALERPGSLPLEISGRGLDGGGLTLDAGESSQYLSALLMAGTRARSAVEVEVVDLASAPYVTLTVEAIERFGGRVEFPAPGIFRVEPGLPGTERVTVEGDWSAACYPAAAAAVTGGTVELVGLDANSAQPDRALLEVLTRMGVEVLRPAGGGVVVSRRAKLTAIEADLRDLPDQAPTLAAIAPFAEGVTRIRNVGHLRLKESDRLQAVHDELRRCGVPADLVEDGLRIPGVWAAEAPPTHEVTVETYDDHRIAMSFAVLALGRPGVRIARPHVVDKSYPGFWDDLERCLEP